MTRAVYAGYWLTMSYDGVSRRHFFFGALLAGAVPSGGYGSVPSLRALGYKPFYDKLNVAAIGCGGQGGVDPERCREDRKHRRALRRGRSTRRRQFQEVREAAQVQRLPRDAREGRQEHRRLHHRHPRFHARDGGAGLHAARQARLRGEAADAHRRGKRALLLEAAAKYKVATQMGNQGFSHECNRVAAEIVWSGAIGDVTEAHISTTPGTHPTGLQEPPPEESVPATLDWDLWLGGASMRPFSSWYVPYNWRGFFDFGTGQIGNWATHTAGPVHVALQLGAPPSVECVSQMQQEQHDLPDRGGGPAGLPGARRHAAGESLLSRFGARRRSGSLITCPGWRTRRSCRRRTIWRIKDVRWAGARRSGRWARRCRGRPAAAPAAEAGRGRSGRPGLW